MVRLKGVEPLAHGLEGRCSILLSYRRAIFVERVKGIGPSQPAWKAGALPLSYTRTMSILFRNRTSSLRLFRCELKLLRNFWKSGAEDEIRTRDPRLGKAMLYH